MWHSSHRSVKFFVKKVLIQLFELQILGVVDFNFFNYLIWFLRQVEIREVKIFHVARIINFQPISMNQQLFVIVVQKYLSIVRSLEVSNAVRP